MRYYLLSLLFVGWTVCASAQLSFNGRLRLLRSVELKVEDLNGNIVLQQNLVSNKDFKTKNVQIQPDLYTLHLGDYKEYVILTNNAVTIKGFLDDKNPSSSNLSFTGIEQHEKYAAIAGAFTKNYDVGIIKEKVKKDPTLDPVVYAALLYVNHNTIGFVYEPFKEALDAIPENRQNSLVVKRLKEETKVRESYAIGASAYDFSFPDAAGKEVKLSDFKGKYVLVDFWASWCGPCRQEMKHLLPIYEELKGDDLVFISISVDDKKENWLKMLKDEQLPWIMLWDEEGFPKGKNLTTIQEAYGFRSIPFIVLLDKEGKYIARKLRGNKVKEAIINARGN